MKINEIIAEGITSGSELEDKVNKTFSKLKLIPGFLKAYNQVANDKQLISDLIADVKAAGGSRQKIWASIRDRVANLEDNMPIAEGIGEKMDAFVNKLFEMLPGLFGLMILAVPFWGVGDAHQKWANIQTLVMMAGVVKLILWFKNKDKKKVDPLPVIQQPAAKKRTEPKLEPKKELELLPKDQYDEQVEEDATPGAINDIVRLSRDKR